jgi:hypothetical protein
MRKMQEILIQLISGSMRLFWVVMLRLGSYLLCWPRSQLATGYQISLTGHSFSNFSSGYTKYACLHSTSGFANTYDVTCLPCFSFLHLGTILHWTGTLWKHKRLCQVLFFSFSGVLNILMRDTLRCYTTSNQDTNIHMCRICKIMWDVICILCFVTWYLFQIIMFHVELLLLHLLCYMWSPGVLFTSEFFLMQIRYLLVGHICLQVHFYLFSPGGYNCLSEIWCLLTVSVSKVMLFIVIFPFADSSFSWTNQYNCATPWFGVFLAWFCIKGLVYLCILY